MTAAIRWTPLVALLRLAVMGLWPVWPGVRTPGPWCYLPSCLSALAIAARLVLDCYVSSIAQASCRALECCLCAPWERRLGRHALVA